jgi:hypothetical protein
MAKSALWSDAARPDGDGKARSVGGQHLGPEIEGLSPAGLFI